MINIAIFASYNGSFLEPILNSDLDVNISLIMTNNSNANVLNKAKKHNIKSYVINNKTSEDIDSSIIKLLKDNNIDLVVLSGYMKKLSKSITNNFKIINCHPSLLPKYGGQGMYGTFVHQAVIDNNESQSGATIHYVNENYDDGEFIVQESFELSADEIVQSLEEKVKKLEKVLIVKAIQKVL